MRDLTLHVKVSDEDYAQLEALGDLHHRSVSGEASDMAEKWLPRELKRLRTRAQRPRRVRTSAPEQVSA
jgi:hypothetical protein